MILRRHPLRRSAAACSIVLLALMVCLLPAAAAPPGVQISDLTDVERITLDSHAGTGYLFAVLYGEGTPEDSISINRSADGGTTWSELARFTYNGKTATAVVLGDRLHVIISYVNSSGYGTLIDSLFSVTSGSNLGLDVFASEPDNSFYEVAVVSNEEDAGTYIWVLAIDSDHRLRWFRRAESNGAWSELDTGITNAGYSLDATWNDDFDAYKIFASYYSYSESQQHKVYFLRWSPGNFDVQPQTPSPCIAVPTAISAHDDYVVLANGVWSDTTFVIEYRVSPDAGDTWYPGWVHPMPLSSDNDYQTVDLTARGGHGIAVLYSEYDRSATGRWDWCRSRDYALSADWNGPYPTYSDAATSQPARAMAVAAMPAGTVHHWGAAMTDATDDSAYFFFPFVIFSDGFESADTTAWSSATP